MLYIWDSIEDIFRIYKLLRNYLGENFSIPENILLRLIDKNELDLEDALDSIAYIHSSYASILINNRMKSSNDNVVD